MSARATPQRFVLASGSPRRRELLAQLGLLFDVEPAHLDETPKPLEEPAAYVLRLAGEKAAAVAQRHPHRIVLAADTTVALGKEILGKPRDGAEAAQMLTQLSGRTHEVFTGISAAGRSRVVRTAVRFRALSPAEIAWYVGTGEPLDKAGAYAVQGRAGAFVEALDGSPTNVIGLPLPETLALLTEAGLTLPFA
jgi:septum formation protein